MAKKTTKTRKPNWTDEQIAAALSKCKGVVMDAAKALGYSRQHLHARIQASDALQAAQWDGRETMADICEGKLHSAIKKGESWAVLFFLKTIGKSRGYVEKTETQLSGEQMIRIDVQGTLKALLEDNEIVDAITTERESADPA